MLTIAILAALVQEEELKLHLRATVNAGVSLRGGEGDSDA
jgi:alkylhydroperoxidase/carboxymuconolactone decarboxylase family protein YurZ